MPLRLPLDLEVEYRGVRPPFDYVRDGERKTAAARLKFEIEKPDGDVEMLELSGSSFDRIEGGPDYAKFKRGDRFHLLATAVIADGEGERSYITVQACEKRSGTPVGAAA